MEGDGDDGGRWVSADASRWRGCKRQRAGDAGSQREAVFLLEGGGSARMLTGGGEPEMQALYFCRGGGGPYETTAPSYMPESDPKLVLGVDSGVSQTLV